LITIMSSSRLILSSSASARWASVCVLFIGFHPGRQSTRRSLTDVRDPVDWQELARRVTVRSQAQTLIG
jgi:hypothetical protein